MVPNWTWRWAWKTFVRWVSLDLPGDDLTPRERWQVVYQAVGPSIRNRCGLPTRDWLHRHLPTWILMRRLRPMDGQWYRIPSIPVALHVWRRLGYQVREHELVKIEQGQVVAIAVFDRRTHCCEFWLVDEIGKPDPRPVEIERAWHAYTYARRHH